MICGQEIDSVRCETVNCESKYSSKLKIYSKESCPVGGDYNIKCISLEELSNEKCLWLDESRYYTYGYTNGSIWVKDGCRANFQACFLTDNEAIVSSSSHKYTEFIYANMTNTTESMTSHQDDSDSDVVGIAVGVTVGGILLVLILVAVILYLRKRQKKAKKITKADIQLQPPKKPITTDEYDAYALRENDQGKVTSYYINKDLVSVPLPPTSNLVGFSVDGQVHVNRYDHISTAATETKNDNRDKDDTVEYNSLQKVHKVEIIPETPYDTCSNDANVYNKLHENKQKVQAIPSDYDRVS